MTKLLYGVGVNDADYQVTPTVLRGGKWVIENRCRIYQMWTAMLNRCYSHAYHKRKPTYVGCSVDKKWHKFSVFRDWVVKQDWEDKTLDKDILFYQNKVYGPKTCVLVDQITNSFFAHCSELRPDLGTCFIASRKKYRASVGNPFTKKNEQLGNHSTMEEAHATWKARKHELALQLAKLQTDKRVAKVLRTRFK